MAANITAPEVFLSVLIAVVLFAVIAAGWLLFERSRERAADTQVREQFTRDMAAVELPPWNGETYEWTPESLAYLADTGAYEQPLLSAPVPPSDISGPLPVQDYPTLEFPALAGGPGTETGEEDTAPGYDPAADARAYIKSMTADTMSFLAHLAGTS